MRVKHPFFRRTIWKNRKFYTDAVESCRRFKRATCDLFDGHITITCKNCPFKIGAYCLMNIIEEEFRED